MTTQNERDKTIKEVARQLAITEGCARKLVNSGAIKAYKIGGVVRVTPEELRRIRGC